jgi:hypothetical protein
VLRLVGEPIGLGPGKGDGSLLPLQPFEEVKPGRPVHLVELLDRDQRGEGLALSFDDELIVPEVHPVEEVAQLLSYLDGGDCFLHGTIPS